MKDYTTNLSREIPPKEPISIFVVWLFAVSGIIGMSIGYYDWFIVKTPLNLLISFALVIINFPIDSVKKVGATLVFFLIGFTVEWVGVHYGILFGAYHYGENLGLKIDGIPLLIGINWAMLTLVTAAMAHQFIKNKILRAVFGALLMVALDFFIEPVAPLFDFWIWDLGHAPLQNFIAWYVISFFLHLIYVKLNIKGEFRFSAHLYMAQLAFFVYFFIYHGV